ncbi:transcription factor 7-like 1-B isoform X1 [Lates japonicus]
MDIPAEFERLLEEMEWGDVVDTFQAVVNDMLGDTSDPLPPPWPPAPAPSPSPSPPPAIPIDLGFDTELEDILSGGYGGCIPLAASSHSFEQPLVVNEILGDTSDPLPSPPAPAPLLPPAIPVELGFDTELEEILSGGYGGCMPPAASPRSFEQPLAAPPGLSVRQAAPIIYQQPLYDQNVMHSGQGYSQAGPYSQGQNLPYQWYDGPGPSNVRALPQQVRPWSTTHS